MNLFQPLVNTSFVVLMLARKNPDMVAIFVLDQADMAPEVHHKRPSNCEKGYRITTTHNNLIRTYEYSIDDRGPSS